jgi:hypothetical protein
VFKDLYTAGLDEIAGTDAKSQQQQRITRAAKAAAMQLGHLISTVDVFPPLPDLSFNTDLNQYSAFPSTVPELSQTLVQEAEMYARSVQARKQEPRIQRKQPGAHPSAQPEAVPMKREMPPMRPDELSRRNPANVHALYGALEHVSRQDGVRFDSMAKVKCLGGCVEHGCMVSLALAHRRTVSLLLRQLNEHLDSLAAKARAKKEAEQTYRTWYCTIEQWVTDFGRLRSEEEQVEADRQQEAEQPEELMVKADEHFPKCPISG